MKSAADLAEICLHREPVAFEVIKKQKYCLMETREEKRKSQVTKNELLRNMLDSCVKNQLKWKYLLADSWFSSAENMKYIHEKKKKYFLLALKSNRLVAFSKEDKLQDRFIRIGSIAWSEEPRPGWIKGLKFLFNYLVRSLKTRMEVSGCFTWLPMTWIYQKRL